MSEDKALPGASHAEDNMENQKAVNDRQNIRLTTVYGGRVCQYGKAYECIISDVSMGGARIKLKDASHFHKFVMTNPAQLVFERLSDYKALNAEVSWLKKNENAVGLKFTDSDLRRRIVIKRLMPNRWRVVNEENENTENPDVIEV